MKIQNLIFAVLLAGFLPLNGNAADVSPANSNFSAGIVASNPTAAAKITQGLNITLSSDVELRGLTAGYLSAAPNEWGYDLNLAFIQMTANGSYANLARFDGDFVRNIDNRLMFKAGLNAIKFVTNDNFKDMQLGFGYQLGLQYRVTGCFELGAAYKEMNTSGDVPVYSSGGAVVGHVPVDYKISGIEVNLLAIF